MSSGIASFPLRHTPYSSGFVYFHYVTPPTFLCRNEDFFNFVVIYFGSTSVLTCYNINSVVNSNKKPLQRSTRIRIQYAETGTASHVGVPTE